MLFLFVPDVVCTNIIYQTSASTLLAVDLDNHVTEKQDNFSLLCTVQQSCVLTRPKLAVRKSFAKHHVNVSCICSCCDKLPTLREWATLVSVK